MTKKTTKMKQIIVTGVLAGSLALASWATKAFYTVTSVIDGDTFITKENRYVRLDRSIDAPEIDSCMGKESKQQLEKLILNKIVFVKVVYVDDRKRLIGSVYTAKGNVGEAMLRKGLATYDNAGKDENRKVLLEASRSAREAKIGVYSPICTQSINPNNPKCNIKANTSQAGKHYSYPGCTSYSEILVQLHFGDKWFCTEKEAKAAGFIKNGDCN